MPENYTKFCDRTLRQPGNQSDRGAMTRQCKIEWPEGNKLLRAVPQ